MDDYEKYLFRGKRKDNGEWVEGFYGIDTICTEQDTYLSTVISKIPKRIYDCESWEVDPDTVEIFTNSTDKNRTKIFEGDIVQAFTRYGTKHIYPIKYRNGTFWFGNWNWIEFLDRFQFREVIGNIHDNPEMLNAAAKDIAADAAQSGLAPAMENFELMGG